MPIVTSAIVAYAKQRADMESGGVVSAAAEWLQLVNYAYLDLWDLVAEHLQDHFITLATFALTGGAGAGSQYIVPTDLNEVRLVEFQTGDNTQYSPVPPFSLSERNDKTRSYRLMGGTMYVLPELSSAGNYRLWYTPAAATLRTTPDDPIDARLERWWEFIGLGAAKRALTKEESDTRAIDDEMGAIAKRIAKLAPKRQGSPRTTASRWNRDSNLTWVNGRPQWLP